MQSTSAAARESDLLAFEIAIKDSNVQSVMCSYNLVNGVYACENPHLLNDVLKNDWGFPGFVMSDWWATHSTVAAALAGLDQEQPDSPLFRRSRAGGRQRPACRSRAWTTWCIAFCAPCTRSVSSTTPTQSEPSTRSPMQAIAQQVEEQGAVLLKNAGGQLPLNPAAVHSIAVIGSNAERRRALRRRFGAGVSHRRRRSSKAIPTRPAGHAWSGIRRRRMKAIQAMAPAATVRFADGTNAAAAASLAAASDVAIVFV